MTLRSIGPNVTCRPHKNGGHPNGPTLLARHRPLNGSHIVDLLDEHQRNMAMLRYEARQRHSRREPNALSASVARGEGGR